MESYLILIKRIFIFFLLISLPVYLFAGAFRHLSVREGLSSRQVYQVCKDSAGFVWAYTHMGVDRYDGNEIRHYKLDETVESKDHVIRCKECLPMCLAAGGGRGSSFFSERYSCCIMH